jgi:hypothetical protein
MIRITSFGITEVCPSRASTGHFRRMRRQSQRILNAAPQAAPWRRSMSFTRVDRSFQTDAQAKASAS